MLDLSKPWHELPLAVADFETTSVDPLTCAPVSVAVVRFHRGEEVVSFSSLLNPGCAIPAEATAIHGITDEMVSGATTLAHVLSDIASVAHNALPVAYNSAFDRTILHRFVEAAPPGTQGRALKVAMFDPAQEWVCPLVIVRGLDRFVSGKGRHRLETTCARWNVSMGTAHDALTDARAAGRLLWAMRTKLGNISAERLIAAVVQRRAEQDAEHAAWRAATAAQRGATQ